MTRRRLYALVVSLITILGVGLAGPAAAAPKPYPVPYNFLLPAVLAGAQINADPPGANIWTCKPSKAHPQPVILVHGLIGNKNTNWQTYAPLLANEGYCVYALTYGISRGTPFALDQFGGLTSMTASAGELKTFVDKVLASTGAKKVDLVGHSEGTLMPNYYAKFLGGASKIDKYVSLAPLWHGTDPAGLATLNQLGTAFGLGPLIQSGFSAAFASGPELLTGSDFITTMRTGGTSNVRGITYTNIVTKYDELVQPYTSGIEPGASNFVVQDFCQLDYSEHFSVVSSPTAAAFVLNALDPAHPRAVPCQLVLPIL